MLQERGLEHGDGRHLQDLDCKGGYTHNKHGDKREGSMFQGREAQSPLNQKEGQYKQLKSLLSQEEEQHEQLESQLISSEIIYNKVSEFPKYLKIYLDLRSV